MRPSVVVSAAAVVAVVAATASRCHAQGQESLVVSVGEKLAKLWNKGEAEFMGHKCGLSVRPLIGRFQVWMQCPGWTDITGRSENRSYSVMVREVAQDFVRKALESHLFTEQDARAWLQV